MFEIEETIDDARESVSVYNKKKKRKNNQSYKEISIITYTSNNI
jgi:hypothetical protein